MVLGGQFTVDPDDATTHPEVTGRDERERRRLLDLLGVAVTGPNEDTARSDVGRLLHGLLDLEQSADEMAADWLRDALHSRR